jgi:hypothetical protein
MIGKYFSNGWKIFADFSNDWKNFSRVFQRLEKFFYGNEDSFKGSVPLIPFPSPSLRFLLLGSLVFFRQNCANWNLSRCITPFFLVDVSARRLRGQQ